MKNKASNPSAFPRPWSKIQQSPDSPAQTSVANEGMSLRDYFAAKAMPSILSRYVVTYNGKPFDWESRDGEPDAIAELSYKMADAMLKERLK